MFIDVHADDYGLTEATSKAIMNGVNAHKLNSISVMPNMQYFEDACVYWKNNLAEAIEPKISIHLNFMEGYCVANKELLPDLVDEEGLFNISWTKLVQYQFHPIKRTFVKRQLKEEIKAQIIRVATAYEIDLEKDLRIDSHQHTHMIPIVMEALVEVLNEQKWMPSYIRISKEAIWPNMMAISLWGKHQIINTIKVVILNLFSLMDKKLLASCKVDNMILSGVFFSGEMSLKRVEYILPYLRQKALKKKCNLEILFHPGKNTSGDLGKEFNHPGANEFYLSNGREIEYEAMMRLNVKELV